MTNYRSLTGGYFSATPLDKTSGPVSIRCNNPGAVNGAEWETKMPGYVSTIETTPGTKTTIFETPEHGAAVYWELLRRYRLAGRTTVRQILTRYIGPAGAEDYIKSVTDQTGLDPDDEIDIFDDDSVLPFAKAQFRHEAGRAIPWSDKQILHGFSLVRGAVTVPNVPPTAVAIAPPWFTRMDSLLGLTEVPGKASNPSLLKMAEVCGGKIKETYGDDSIPWCSLAVNYSIVSTGWKWNDSLWALDSAKTGIKLSGPAVGAVATKKRDGGGHVTLIRGRDKNGKLVCTGGNQSDMICDETFDPNVFVSYNWPEGYTLPQQGLDTLPVVVARDKEKREVELPEMHLQSQSKKLSPPNPKNPEVPVFLSLLGVLASFLVSHWFLIALALGLGGLAWWYFHRVPVAKTDTLPAPIPDQTKQDDKTEVNHSETPLAVGDEPLKYDTPKLDTVTDKVLPDLKE